MKYARLPLSDLKDLEKEFIQFLIVNGIEAKEWERIKKEEKEKSAKIIDQFSDVIWEGVLRKNNKVELRRKSVLTLCKVADGKITTLVIKPNDSKLDLTEVTTIRKMLSNNESYSLSVKEDDLTVSSEQKLFELIQVGFYLTNEEAYNKLF